jgi:ABC-type glycerol-3-phosphate transport system substrate-binding protein
MSERINRRDFLKTAVTAAAGVALASCTPKATEVPPVEPTKAPPAVATAVPPADTPVPVGDWKNPTFKGTLEYWDWAHPALAAHGEAIIADWKTMYPDITINRTTLEWADYQTKAMAAGAAKSGPDFSQVHQIWKFDMIRGGYLEPFPDDFTDWDKKYSTPFNRDPDTGKIYNFTIDNITPIIFVNPELLASEGLTKADIPRKWDDFMPFAQQLTKKDASGTFTQTGCSFNDNYVRTMMWYSFIYQLGGWVYGEDRASALWNSDEAIAALQFLQDWYHKWGVEDPVGLGGADAFGNGQAPLFLTYGYYAGALDSRYPVIANKWDAVSIPTFTGTGLPAWGLVQPDDGFCISAWTTQEKKDAAFKFISDTSTGLEGEKGWMMGMASPSDYKDLATDDFVKTKPNLAAQVECLPYCINIAENPSEADKFLQEMFDEIVLNKGDIKAAADSAVEQMNAAFAATSDKKRFILERSYVPPSM